MRSPDIESESAAHAWRQRHPMYDRRGLRESQLMQFQNGVIDRTTWETYRSPFPSVLKPEVARSPWETLVAMGTINANFAREINEYLEVIPDEGPCSDPVF